MKVGELCAEVDNQKNIFAFSAAYRLNWVRRKHATAPLWDLLKHDRRDRKMTFLAQGTADGIAKK